MFDLAKLIQYLDQELEVSTIDDFCPNGLQVDRNRDPIKKLATAVSASLETINKAIEIKADVLLVHHGLFWKKDNYQIIGSKREKILKLLNANIALLAYHLPLDCHKTWGNNWAAANQMGWKDLKGFGPKCGNHSIGVMGSIDPINRLEFQKKLETFYHHNAHIALGGPEEIKRVALISGGAHREIHKAVEEDVDAFITGSFDEPIWHIAQEEKINFFAMGHANTEKIGPMALGEHLMTHFNLEYEFIDIENPF